MRFFAVILMTVALLPCFSLRAVSMGEDVLALTGQYTFFLKTHPASPVTYYQKTVPCISKEVVYVSRTRHASYPATAVSRTRQSVRIIQIPVGAHQNANPCVDCFPRESVQRIVRGMKSPRSTHVSILQTDYEPRLIKRRIRLPHWFEVHEDPLPPARGQKILPWTSLSTSDR